jgi:hypothetical protein
MTDDERARMIAGARHALDAFTATLRRIGELSRGRS